jgi:hypothetical protein
MRTLKRLSLFVLILTLALVGGGGVLAQDAMMEPGTVVCDADLILSLYNAEYHFDYAAVHDQVMAMAGDSMMEPGFKLTDFDYGQFAPLFDGMMTMMDDSMSMGMTDEATMAALVGMMSMSMEDMEKAMMAAAPEDSMMAEMTTLPSGDIPGEPAQCTALRANLRQFYVALAAENAMSMMAETS